MCVQDRVDNGWVCVNEEMVVSVDLQGLFSSKVKIWRISTYIYIDIDLSIYIIFSSSHKPTFEWFLVWMCFISV